MRVPPTRVPQTEARRAVLAWTAPLRIVLRRTAPPWAPGDGVTGGWPWLSAPPSSWRWRPSPRSPRGLSGPARPSSAIPSPPRENKTFVEDNDGTGADNQANILHSAAPGLVHVLSARGTPAGAGVILTPSGLVLTGDQVLQSARRATVRLVLSGRSFPARLVGADASHGLGLLQIVGGPAFRPIAVGNSRYLGRGAAVTAVGSSGLTRTFTLNIGNLTGGTGAVAGGGQRLTGLLVSTARVVRGEETGGPLVNLSGQAVGINVAGTGSGLHHTGFAVPINEALAVAKSIQASHSG